ncbi:MAG TPA: hypothetical protein PLC42_05610 [Parachlamydiaceae bacterium]|nr:hypothetical protein [Parachlamydiaceae bacterium]
MFKHLIFSFLSFSFLIAAASILEKDVPEIPRNALKRLTGSSEIEEISMEKDDDAYFYHAKWKNGAAYAATVTEDGNLTIFIEEIPKDKVPFKVRKTVESLLSKATVVEYEKQTFLVYKISATVDDKKYEALISPSGKMVGIKEVLNP